VRSHVEDSAGFRERTGEHARRSSRSSPPPGSKLEAGECTSPDTRKAARGRLHSTHLTMNRDHPGFTPKQLRKLRSLRDPHGIQKYVDAMPYHLADTAWSPRRVLEENTSHCLEGAIFAAAALRANGFPPLIVDLEADHDTDHVLAVYRVDGHWGAVAKSNYTGCRYREPVYRTLRELALSYFNIYFNLRKERTLRRFSRPVNLARFDRLDWMTTDKPVWFIVYHLLEIPHYPLFSKRIAARLHRVDERVYQAEILGKAYKRGD